MSQKDSKSAAGSKSGAAAADSKSHKSGFAFSRGYASYRAQSVEDAVAVSTARSAASVVPDACLAARVKRDGDAHHITILFKDELSEYFAANSEGGKTKEQVLDDLMAEMRAAIAPAEWIDCGLARATSSGGDKTYYHAIHWPSAAAFRAKIGLPVQHFHITVGFAPADVFGVDKSPLSTTNPILVPNLRTAPLALLQLSDSQIRTKHYDEAIASLDIAIHLLTSSTANAKGATATAAAAADTKSDAKSDAKSAATAVDTPFGVLASCLSYRAHALLATKQYDNARLDGERLVKDVASGWVFSYARLGSALMSLKLYNEAIAVFETGLKIGLASSNEKDKSAVEVIRRSIDACQQKLIVALAATIVPHERFVYKFTPAPAAAAAMAGATGAAAAASAANSKTAEMEVKMARNFSWLIPGKLAGMSVPTKHEQILALEAMNVRLIVTAMVEKPLPREWFAGSSIQNLYFPVVNYKPPTIAQIDQYLRDAEYVIWGPKTPPKPATGAAAAAPHRPAAVLVHCGGGKGRAGTLIACFMVKHGLDGSRNLDSENPVRINASEAIATLRRMRPGSIESTEQEEAIQSYAQHLYARAADGDTDAAAEAAAVAASRPAVQRTEKELKAWNDTRKLRMKESPKFVCLMGLPGSGKSWLSNRLLTVNNDPLFGNAPKWVRVSQDDLGGKQETEAYFGSIVRKGKDRIVMDRCNPEMKDRSYWLDMAGTPPKASCLIYVATPPEACRQRLKTRTDHPTISQEKALKKGDSIVADFVKRMQPPTHGTPEGGFGHVYVVNGPAEVDDLLETVFGVAPPAPSASAGAPYVSPASAAAAAAAAAAGDQKDAKSSAPAAAGSGKKSPTLAASTASAAAVAPLAANGKKSPTLAATKAQSTPPRSPVLTPTPIASASGGVTVVSTGKKSPTLSATANRPKTPPTIAAAGADAKSSTADQKHKSGGGGKRSPPTSASGKKNGKSGGAATAAAGAKSNGSDDEAAGEDDSKEGNMKGFFKFPRTHHLFDVGGMSRDDLLVEASDAAQFTGGKRWVIAQEKIDGANLGITVSNDGTYSLRCQNRSHFVNSATATQFNNLDQWLTSHRAELLALIEPDVHVLFGEWVRAKHSIHYDSLPDYFLAFDLYNKQTGKFDSVKQLTKKLEATSIKMVPTVKRAKFASKAEIEALLDTKSSFRDDGYLEGVYLRIDEDEDPNAAADTTGLYLERRCKVVRSDFIAGIDTHWMKQTMVKNGVRLGS